MTTPKKDQRKFKVEVELAPGPILNEEGHNQENMEPIDPMRMKNILDIMEVVAFQPFKTEIDNAGSFGTDDDMAALAATVISAYQSMTEEKKKDYARFGGDRIQGIVRVYCLHIKKDPQVYEQWKAFWEIVYTKTIHNFSFS